jgi:hypothetical protein
MEHTFFACLVNDRFSGVELFFRYLSVIAVNSESHVFNKMSYSGFRGPVSYPPGHILPGTF